MSELLLGDSKAWPKKRWPVVSIATALLGAAVIRQAELAHAAHGGGGGGRFHGGGGFHGGGFGGFHGGGFPGGRSGGFRGSGFHAGFANLHSGFGDGHEGHWNHGWHNGRYGWWWGDGLGGSYYPYDYGCYGYPDYGYSGYAQPYAGQTRYYCSNPAGYYPLRNAVQHRLADGSSQLTRRSDLTRLPFGQPGETVRD